MSKHSHCQMTTKDFAMLEVMLEHSRLHDEAFIRVLRQKLSTAKVVFQDDIDPRIATLNSRVEYAVGEGPSDDRILVQGEQHALPGLTLPVETMRGLALLGLRAGQRIEIERADGVSEEVRLLRVAYQPEAASRIGSHRTLFRKAAGRRDDRARVVRLMPSSGYAMAELRGAFVEPTDDDPGPRAA